jgi:ATP diphosphatase
MGRAEMGRAEAAPASAGDRAKDRLRDEIGDLLFAVANLARHLEIDPESALARTNLEFRRRFAHIERGLAARGKSVADATLAEMDALWEEAKLAAPSGESAAE